MLDVIGVLAKVEIVEGEIDGRLKEDIILETLPESSDLSFVQLLSKHVDLFPD